MSHSILISEQELATHLKDPGFVIVDCRFDLMDHEKGFSNYQNSHIPGAVYAHLDGDLAGPISFQTGRHPLPDINEFVKRLSSWGIKRNTKVVVYDTVSGAFAARLWWMLTSLGHPEVAILNGGFNSWMQANLPITAGIEMRKPSPYFLQEDAQWSCIVNSAIVDQIRHDPSYKLVDVRSPERFRGDVEPIDPVAGHIPGAVNRAHAENLQADGKLKPPAILYSEFTSLLDGIPPEKTVVYCGSGVTSCFHIFAMRYAGMESPKLYPGSWSEWIRDPHHQIEKSAG
jgi:thiosulfate/3-mercaptopyruvate sulfurtransferase